MATVAFVCSNRCNATSFVGKSAGKPATAIELCEAISCDHQSAFHYHPIPSSSPILDANIPALVKGLKPRYYTKSIIQHNINTITQSTKGIHHPPRFTDSLFEQLVQVLSFKVLIVVLNILSPDTVGSTRFCIIGQLKEVLWYFTWYSHLYWWIPFISFLIFICIMWIRLQ